LEKRDSQTNALPSEADTFQIIRGTLHALRLAWVLSLVAITIVLLYPSLEASAHFRFRYGQRVIARTFHRIIGGLLGLNVSIKGQPSSNRPLLVVANHVSWLDIVVISSILPAIFVTQHGVASWPVFGRLAKLSPSIFVNRERKLEVLRTINCISDALSVDDVVAIFPEGTSTDGTVVLPFRSALFGAVHETLRKAKRLPAVYVQPVSVRYIGPNRRFAAWAREDDIPFFLHLLRVVRVRRIDIMLRWETPIAADIHSDRKILAKKLETTIRHSASQT
jgi:1-acyl-sn-glycerol-3-phosphate acyltransferase